MMVGEYMEQRGLEFVLPQNPGNYPQGMGSAQEQALRTEKIWQNQALFRKYIALDGDFKNQIVTMVESVFLSPLVNQLTGFGQVSALIVLQHLLYRYGAIDGINLEENAVKTMGPSDPAEPLSQLINQLEKGDISQEQEARKSLTPWLCQKESPFRHKREFSMMT